MNLPRAMWNGDVYPKDPNAINVGFHDGLMSWMIPGGGPLKAAKWSTTITRAVGAAPKGFSKFKQLLQSSNNNLHVMKEIDCNKVLGMEEGDSQWILSINI